MYLIGRDEAIMKRRVLRREEVRTKRWIGHHSTKVDVEGSVSKLNQSIE
jgi:hypothetical protein